MPRDISPTDTVSQIDGDEIYRNEQGGFNSRIKGAFSLLPSKALTYLAMVHEYGAKKYAVNNWRKVTVKEHVDHAASHLVGEGGVTDLTQNFTDPITDQVIEELAHAFCRSGMALENALELFEKENNRKADMHKLGHQPVK